MSARHHVAIDLHCHLLPGLDDGARDLGDTVEMALQAEADGIGAICATPHIRHDHDVRIAELPRRCSEASSAIRAAGCRTQVLSGAEVAATAVDGLDQPELDALTLGGGGRWILLEPAPGPLDDGLQHVVEDLRMRGFRAVIAHPERHLGCDLVSRLRRLTMAGSLVQATGAAFTDDRTRAGMLELVRGGVLHVLGSDAHSARAGRRVELTSALETMCSVRPAAVNRTWIARTAPRAIVHGVEVTAPF